MYVLSQRSKDRLKGVKPELVKVVERAIQITEIDFMVIEGLRSVEQQKENVRKGVSKTMNSYHLTGEAVDLGPLVNKAIPWQDWSKFELVAKAMKQAANELGITIEWGGDWKTFKDGPHFQLKR
ncbi:endolysin [Proteus phage phiP4-3]|uniref:Endolysin n=1 Tax=Proteus phage phiP4-3 TaxID=2065203 RepID=A0A2I6PFM8_9CAUD|nr:endolysin [Proteus phage phiP4-3]AUM58523.1 endolysin [Proteus phage phiP4-3]